MRSVWSKWKKGVRSMLARAKYAARVFYPFRFFSVFLIDSYFGLTPQAQYRQLKSFPTGHGLRVRRSHIHGWGLFAEEEFPKGIQRRLQRVHFCEGGCATIRQ